VHLGSKKAAFLALTALFISVGVIAYLFGISFPALKWIASLSVLMAGAYLLLIPVVKLLLTRNKAQAMVLFNRASYFPLTLLCLALALIGVR